MQLQPKSILHLVFISYIALLLPLGLMAYHTITSFNTMTQLNRQHMAQAVHLTRHQQHLQVLISDIERSLLQYEIIASPALKEVLTSQSHSLSQLLNKLRSTGGLPIHHLEALEGIAKAVATSSAAQASLSQNLSSLLNLLKESHPLLAQSQKASTSHVNELLQKSHTRIETYKQKIYFGILALLPALVLLICLFAYLIGHPMAQLCQAIDALGQGQRRALPRVKGPSELQVLGQRLHWLGQRLEELEEDKATFLRHMSHELKTPLSGIIEASRLLKEQVTGRLNPEQQEIVTILIDNAQNLHQHIEAIIEFNRLQTTLELSHQPIFMIKLMTKLAQQQKLLLDSKAITLELPSKDLELYGDPARFELIFSNLLLNAIHFSPRKASIVLNWHMSPTDFFITITDEGPGITDEEANIIFQPFQQGSIKRSGAIKGTGLGLAIARECIEAHNGSIKVLPSDKGAKIEVSGPHLIQQYRGHI